MDDNEMMLTVTIYCDSTDLYTEEEIECENMCELDFPERIVKEWYKANEKECIEDQLIFGYSREEACFDLWISKVYDCDGTDGLYDFAKERGYQARRAE